MTGKRITPYSFHKRLICGILQPSYQALFYEGGILIASERRKDSKGRNLRDGECERGSGGYMYRYTDVRKKRRYIYAPTLENCEKKNLRYEAYGRQVQ